MLPTLVCTISMHLYHYEPLISFLSYLPFYYKNPIYYLFPLICIYPTGKNIFTNNPTYYSNMLSLIFLLEDFPFYIKKQVFYSYNFSNFTIANINCFSDILIFLLPLVVNLGEYNLLLCNMTYLISLIVIYFYYLNEFYLFQWYFGSKMMILMVEIGILNIVFLLRKIKNNYFFCCIIF